MLSIRPNLDRLLQEYEFTKLSRERQLYREKYGTKQYGVPDIFYGLGTAWKNVSTFDAV